MRRDHQPHAGVGEIDAILMNHLRAIGGMSTHRALADWAVTVGVDGEDLDRCLVRVGRAGVVCVDIGMPPCSETRTVALADRARGFGLPPAG